jgi:hypothetical protein
MEGSGSVLIIEDPHPAQGGTLENTTHMSILHSHLGHQRDFASFKPIKVEIDRFKRLGGFPQSLEV